LGFDSLLNKQCVIYKLVETLNSSNGERTKSRSIKHIGVPCRLQTLSGKELLENNKIYANASHTIFLSKMYDVKLTDIILIDGTYFNLLLQKDAGGQEHHYEYLVETVK